MNKEINYKGTKIEDIYALALIGADFCVEKNDGGIAVVNSLNKELYVKTVLASRLLNIVDLPEDRVMSLENHNKISISIDGLKGRGIKRLKADFSIFNDMLNVEINNLLMAENDCINRINNLVANEITPERIEHLKEQTDSLIAQVKEA